MSSQLASEILSTWWDRFRTKQYTVILLDAAVFITGVLFLNPEIHKWVGSAKLGLADGSLSISELLFACCAALLLGAVTALLSTVFFTSAYNYLTGINTSINSIGFKGADLSSVKIKLQFMPAQKILLGSNPVLFHKTDETQIIYQIAETKECVEKNYIFTAFLTVRLTLFFVIGLAINIGLGLINSSSLLVAVTNTMLLIIAMIISEALFTVFSRSLDRKSLKAIAANSLKKPKRVWAEYDLVAKRCLIGQQGAGILSIGDTSVEEMVSKRASEDGVIKDALLALKTLNDRAYSTIFLINESERDVISDVEIERHSENINYLIGITKSYVPACVNKINKNLKAVEVTNLFQQSERANGIKIKDRVTPSAYLELQDDISKQMNVISDMQTYYNTLIETLALNDFRDVIEKQSNNWVDETQVYSQKTKVLDKNLNHIAIPELEALLIGADSDTQNKIKSKISEIRTFFAEQVALDKQDYSAKELDYDRAVTITGSNMLSTDKDPVDAHIEKIDFYLKQLKQSW